MRITRITYKDLKEVVNAYNKRYCQKTKHHLAVASEYGGYKIVLTGKKYKKADKWRGYLGSGTSSITYGYQNARDTINDFLKAEYNGSVKSSIKYWERIKTKKIDK